MKFKSNKKGKIKERKKRTTKPKNKSSNDNNR